MSIFSLSKVDVDVNFSLVIVDLIFGESSYDVFYHFLLITCDNSNEAHHNFIQFFCPSFIFDKHLKDKNYGQFFLIFHEDFEINFYALKYEQRKMV